MNNSHWVALVAKWNTYNDNQKRFVMLRAETLALKMGKPEWLERFIENVVMGADPNPTAREA